MNLNKINIFDLLPFEITCSIIDYLHIMEQFALRRVNKFFYNNFPQVIYNYYDIFWGRSVGIFKTLNPRVLQVELCDTLNLDEHFDLVDDFHERTDCVVDCDGNYDILDFNVQLSHMTNLKRLYLENGFYPIDYLSKLDLDLIVIDCCVYDMYYEYSMGIYVVKDCGCDLDYYRCKFEKIIETFKAKKIIIKHKAYKKALKKLGYTCNEEGEFVLKG